MKQGRESQRKKNEAEILRAVCVCHRLSFNPSVCANARMDLGCFPPEVVAYYSPEYPQVLLKKMEEDMGHQQQVSTLVELRACCPPLPSRPFLLLNLLETVVG